MSSVDNGSLFGEMNEQKCCYGLNCVPRNSWSDTTPQVPVFGDGASKGVIQVKCGHRVRPSPSVCVLTGRERQRCLAHGDTARRWPSAGEEVATHQELNLPALALAFQPPGLCMRSKFPS